MSGISVVADGEDLNIYKIIDVMADSPADKADIRVDDTIEAINGITYEKLRLHDMYQIFNYREGKKIKLNIRRDGRLMYKTFRLESLL